MAIFLDDQPVDLDGQDLAEVLSRASSHLEHSGRIVVEVQVDGRALKGADLDERTHEQLEAGEVRLYSADPCELSRRVLESLKSQIDHSRQLQAEAAELIQRDETPDAMEQLRQVVEIWQKTQQAVLQSIVLVGINLDDVQVDGGSASAMLESVVEQLTTARDVIANGDFVVLADTLAYEWPALADRWQQLLGCLIERIDQMS